MNLVTLILIVMKDDANVLMFTRKVKHTSVLLINQLGGGGKNT
jgi:hypothetical protein